MIDRVRPRRRPTSACSPTCTTWPNNGDDVDAAIADHADRVAHVQIADAPGRGEPGSGDLPLTAGSADLERPGYAGWVGLEYKPTTTTAESLAWLPASVAGPPHACTKEIRT